MRSGNGNGRRGSASSLATRYDTKCHAIFLSGLLSLENLVLADQPVLYETSAAGRRVCD